MSCRRPPVASVRRRPGRQAELLAYLNGSQRYAAGVLFRVFVLLRQGGRRARGCASRGRPAPRRRAHSRGGRRQRTRLNASMEVEGQAPPTAAMPPQLETVPDPPAKLTEVEREGGDQRAGEPGEPDDRRTDRRQRRVSRKVVQGAQTHQSVQDQADSSRMMSAETGRLGNRRARGWGRPDPRTPRIPMAASRTPCNQRSGRHAFRAAQGGAAPTVRELRRRLEASHRPRTRPSR